MLVRNNMYNTKYFQNKMYLYGSSFLLPVEIACRRDYYMWHTQT